MKEKLGFLKTTKIKTIPVWMILLITIGTATGALLLISNQITTTVNPSQRPIELTCSFDSSPYINEPSVQSFTYEVNDFGQDVGYVVIDFWTSGGSDNIGPTNFTIDVMVTVGASNMVFTQIVAGYPLNNGPYSLTYVFEDSLSGPIDFSFSDTEPSGYIDVTITYQVTTTWMCTFTSLQHHHESVESECRET